jgi:hypothetical protein
MERKKKSKLEGEEGIEPFGEPPCKEKTTQENIPPELVAGKVCFKDPKKPQPKEYQADPRSNYRGKGKGYSEPKR